MKKSLVLCVSIVMVMIFALSACGSANNSSNAQSKDQKVAKTLNITATDFKFNKQTYKVPANKNIKINFQSKQGTHGLGIDGTKVDIEGKGSTVVKLKPGTYHVHCTVPCGNGHGDMKAEIIAQ
ncbi:cupredoxin domain-containing protein [Scopulibacillus cellulosilyticus]|uniref:Cupredoxin domain-containing protein n=1 Tax=Scopulibacillus cellulosilyticus TaxID=2665665 RepID=A0ABW2Q064_9BACL